MEDKKKKVEEVNKCAKEVQEVLNKYNCFIDVSVNLSSEGFKPNIVIRKIETSRK